MLMVCFSSLLGRKAEAFPGGHSETPFAGSGDSDATASPFKTSSQPVDDGEWWPICFAPVNDGMPLEGVLVNNGADEF